MLSTSRVIQRTSGTDGPEALSMTLVSYLDYFSLASALSSHLSEMWNLTFGKGFGFVSCFWVRGHQAFGNEGKTEEKELCWKTGKNIALLAVQQPWGDLLVTRGLPWVLWGGRGQAGNNKVILWHQNPSLPRTICLSVHALHRRWGHGSWLPSPSFFVIISLRETL